MSVVFLPNIIRVVKTKKNETGGHVARMWDRTDAFLFW